MKKQKKMVDKKITAKKIKSAKKTSIDLKKKTTLLQKIRTRTLKRASRAVGVLVQPGVNQKVSESKFYSGFEPKKEFSPAPSAELPSKYDVDQIIAQVRDSWWIHVYWEVRPSTIEGIKQNLNGKFEGAQPALRVYDVSAIHFNGKNAHKYFDIYINFDISNWYIDLGEAGRSWCVDIGFRLSDGTFITIARSNTVTTPIDGPSWMTDEEWMIPDDKFARLYGMGFGFGVSSPGRKGWIERMKFPIGSPGLFSITSPVRKLHQKGKKGFWFTLDAELIIYGATEPDAKVTLDGQPIKLNADGTFSLRYPLPDGKRIVPVEARSSDGLEFRSLTPIVTRETR